MVDVTFNTHCSGRCPHCARRHPVARADVPTARRRPVARADVLTAPAVALSFGPVSPLCPPSPCRSGRCPHRARRRPVARADVLTAPAVALSFGPMSPPRPPSPCRSGRCPHRARRRPVVRAGVPTVPAVALSLGPVSSPRPPSPCRSGRCPHRPPSPCRLGRCPHRPPSHLRMLAMVDVTLKSGNINKIMVKNNTTVLLKLNQKSDFWAWSGWTALRLALALGSNIPKACVPNYERSSS